MGATVDLAPCRADVPITPHRHLIANPGRITRHAQASHRAPLHRHNIARASHEDSCLPSVPRPPCCCESTLRPGAPATLTGPTRACSVHQTLTTILPCTFPPFHAIQHRPTHRTPHTLPPQ